MRVPLLRKASRERKRPEGSAALRVAANRLPVSRNPKGNAPLRSLTIVTALALFMTTGCQQKMAHQPHFRPLQDAEFFSDGSSARPLEEGTIARGFLRDDDLLTTGRQTKDGKDQLATEFPFTITKERLEHGRDQFNIYCAICHDRVGTGRGKVVQRGYLRPPTYHQSRLREAPVGHFFEVITRGYGGMPDYAQQIPPTQRWEIIAYIRALQLSQNVRLDDLPADERKRLEEEKK